ncbi:PQQ-dependent sugar dehydrogenase [Blastopirellula sp. JC732]|uniref:PQQ-dependent sugar dehydrogenase n=1 Tax=Blastopirellula sediminis TaxID=2894196 RepID=A0A9X1MN13_9BACT|nr:PQQ-dependent sugar dehydrogenase [Blastopirellula sediminis]MCC9607058.1 PQQ-dependent sugar dehydrogenase [Blastopirellula sediminis]MCC9629649.1 PQQ-dependent sugar dehydrogenase [Blastopirellula sediminis]
MPLRRTFSLFVLLAMFAAVLRAEDTAPVAFSETPLDTVEMVRTFKNLRIRRPLIITNAGDGSGRLFIAEQQGVIHIMPKDEAEGETTEVFLDIEKNVHFNPRQNEEGFLGFAFHPDYKSNGKFYAYYTTEKEPQLSVISEFSVSKDDPNKADPASEKVIMTIKQPFWNHNGGTIEFGPDGYLYIGLGDGGSGGDPNGNGQNLSTLLGSILRIDVDHQADGKNYAIPADNPFVGVKDACPEIYAYGLRNVWRFSFDHKTGVLWCGEVGQDIWEEIDLIVKGGNYGWNKREGFHQFKNSGVDANDKMMDPIWEYDHNVGKSITGGVVYRGTAVPELVGKYLYADYVTGKVWALDYDLEAKKVKGNYRIANSSNPPVVTFGQDESGDVIVSAIFGEFGTLYRFKSKK